MFLTTVDQILIVNVTSSNIWKCLRGKERFFRFISIMKLIFTSQLVKLVGIFYFTALQYFQNFTVCVCVVCVRVCVCVCVCVCVRDIKSILMPFFKIFMQTSFRHCSQVGKCKVIFRL